MQYKGGKNASGVYQRIINQIPPHDTYIEPFLGSGAIMRLKKPASCSIGIDVDMDIIKQWEDLGYGAIVTYGEAISFLKNWKPSNKADRVFIYLDPPYLMSTRSYQEKLYRHEFSTVEEHTELLELMLSLPYMMAISGYRSKLYDQMLRKWRRVDYQVMTRGHTKAVESLWMNYPEPWELHDYSYLGSNYRERERIAKRKRRWSKNLATMTALERYAMLDALERFRKAST